MLRMVATAERSHGFEQPFAPPGADVAVLLNANAKQVTPGVRRALSSVLPDEHLFVSRCADEAAAIADEVVARRYRTVFTGGGDGTFVSWVNRILESAERRAARPPCFGVLALGTGNAVAGVVGATPRRHVQDLLRFVRGEVGRVRRLDLVSCGDRLTPFAGVGIDAAVLNDYIWLKSQLAGTPLRRLGLGASGYGLAIALRSAPRCLVERRPTYCEIVNVGRPAWRLDARGNRVGRPIAHGELLYAGPCMMAAASTVPYYGLGLRAFPFAGQAPGMMQVRVATSIPIRTLLTSVPSIWAGRFAHRGLLDFHADRVAMRFEKPMPLQIGGDAEGWRDELTFGMAPQPVDLVDFGTPCAAA
ncbi:diacylglycerol kinase catalytic region [Anaeromyxobacter sp. K]|uniref:diacylglycerol/lipid kinase family protein n=1 Tax=Anaeromyxobacter sp. (strain K) TaxID=447217 RepID=UPI00015F9A1F|nr:diacylglycerol kinase family protein [Anaeromyxobacter sp. K]ACG73511.1 diacylglycerol kinase catalytic region [Anaeromyxobacter sp. K]